MCACLLAATTTIASIGMAYRWDLASKQQHGTSSKITHAVPQWQLRQASHSLCKGNWKYKRIKQKPSPLLWQPKKRKRTFVFWFAYKDLKYRKITTMPFNKKLTKQHMAKCMKTYFTTHVQRNASYIAANFSINSKTSEKRTVE